MNERQTIFSPCRQYRYTLWRDWSENLFHDPMRTGYAMFIGLNPSTADETKDDPTIRKCIGFAKRWGYGALCMTNLFAFRATDPKVMKRHENPVGEDNHHHLLWNANKAGIVVAAWGVHGKHKHQDLTVLDWLGQIGVRLQCLRKTKDGHPEHPLYVPYDAQTNPL